ncbi:MAG TPA: TadE/TadG family type IV pilus assembly protein [Planctomycetaceae bacterium]|nr:TadE/TadG family type IV pilus assembly protein [Planctomycetaceae bacterium]
MIRRLSVRVCPAHRRAAALVEMALVLPVFLAVVMGIIEFGRGLWVGNMVTNAAREGARMAVLDGSSNTEVRQAIKDFLGSAVGATAATEAIISIAITPAPGNTNPGHECANASTRDLIAVTVTMPFNSVAMVPGKYLAGTNLTGKSAMRHE